MVTNHPGVVLALRTPLVHLVAFLEAALRIQMPRAPQRTRGPAGADLLVGLEEVVDIREGVNLARQRWVTGERSQPAKRDARYLRVVMIAAKVGSQL